jgi:hypothetical protein
LKEVLIEVFNNSKSVKINLILFVPNNAKKPVPAFLLINNRGKENTDPTRATKSEFWPAEMLIDSGYAIAAIHVADMAPDDKVKYVNGTLELYPEQLTADNGMKAIGAWAWGASRALDYFETDKAVDAKRVGIEGHSRYGKATAVAMAYDPRFAIAFISSSGEGGVKLHRRNAGELVENVASANEYHWMAGNFLKYAGPLTWNDLPVDAHELIALCAPRPVFISVGENGDAWVDAKGTFMAAAAAGPVYKLLRRKDLGTDQFPPVETSLIDGEVAFRQHSGGHTPAPNWPTFLTFAGRYFNRH